MGLEQNPPVQQMLAPQDATSVIPGQGMGTQPGPQTFNVPGQNTIQNLMLGISQGSTLPTPDFGIPNSPWHPALLGAIGLGTAVAEPGPDVGPLFKGAKKALAKFAKGANKLRLDDIKALGFNTDKVWFHGTPNVYEGVPDPYQSRFGLFGGGAYFTEAPDVAAGYAKAGTTVPGVGRLSPGQDPTKLAPNIKPAFLSVRNPIDMDAVGDVNQWTKSINNDVQLRGISPEELSNRAQMIAFRRTNKVVSPENLTNEDYFKAVLDVVEESEIYAYEASEIVQSSIERMGFDGITHIGGGRVAKDGVRHKVIIAFHPEQITSVFSSVDDLLKNFKENPFQTPDFFR